MTIRFFVNFALLAIPIAATLGILFGIQTHRQATGQTPLFAPKPLHGITKTRYCQKAFGIHPKSKGQEYTRKFLLGGEGIRPNYAQARIIEHKGKAGRRATRRFLCNSITELGPSAAFQSHERK